VGNLLVKRADNISITSNDEAPEAAPGKFLQTKVFLLQARKDGLTMHQLAKSRSPRSVLKYLLFGGVLCVGGLLSGTAFYIVETIIRPTRPPRSRGRTLTPFELSLPAETVTFAPRQGRHRVHGWFIPSPGATSTIIVCPGYRSSKSDTLGICGFLWKAGHNILTFEYHGHGSEVGTAITLGYREQEDFLGALLYAKRRAAGTRLGVLAYSMGAAVAIMCSARCSEIEAIIADSAFATHTRVVDYHVRRRLHMPSAPFVWLADHLLNWRAGYRFHQVEPLRDIPFLASRPLLIIHGGADTTVDPQDAFLLYRAAREPKELWIVPEADHCGAYFVDRPRYVRKVTAFFEEHLQRQPVQPHLIDYPAVEHMLALAKALPSEALLDEPVLEHITEPLHAA
jgi:fermentation-respiration switch protein FrsA (DUF1100 family)